MNRMKWPSLILRCPCFGAFRAAVSWLNLTVSLWRYDVVTSNSGIQGRLEWALPGGGCVATGAVSLIDLKVKLNQLYKVFYSY